MVPMKNYQMILFSDTQFSSIKIDDSQHFVNVVFSIGSQHIAWVLVRSNIWNNQNSPIITFSYWFQGGIDTSGTLLGLRQVLKLKTLKNDEKCLLFHLESSFYSQDT